MIRANRMLQRIRTCTAAAGTAALVAAGLAPLAAGAATVTLDSVYRYAEADVYTFGDPPATRQDSAADGLFYGELWVTNPPPNQPATGVHVIHNSTLRSDGSSLALVGSYWADPYWYWFQNEWYAFGAEVHFALDSPMMFELAMDQSCWYWKSDTHYCPTRDANFAAALDGTAIGSGAGVLAAGSHVFSVGSWAINPWNGYQTMNFDFSLSALPVPSPGTLALAGVALAALALTRRNSSRSRKCRPVLPMLASSTGTEATRQAMVRAFIR